MVYKWLGRSTVSEEGIIFPQPHFIEPARGLEKIGNRVWNYGLGEESSSKASLAHFTASMFCHQNPLNWDTRKPDREAVGSRPIRLSIATVARCARTLGTTTRMQIRKVEPQCKNPGFGMRLKDLDLEGSRVQYIKHVFWNTQ